MPQVKEFKETPVVKTVIIPAPGSIAEYDTAAGRVMIIGGVGQFTRRVLHAPPNTGDTIFGSDEVFRIRTGNEVLEFRPFQPDKSEASPVYDPAV